MNLFFNKYKSRIESKIAELEKEFYDNHAQMSGFKKTLEPEKYIKLELKNYDIEKLIKLLKSLL